MTTRHKGLTVLKSSGPTWTGEVRLVSEALAKPMRWRKPRRIFVDSMSDLFHEGVPNDYIAAVFGVMASAWKHTFIILTKRCFRMRSWFAWAEDVAREQYGDLPDPLNWMIRENAMLHLPTSAHRLLSGRSDWPLPNVQLGVSVESQDYVERIDDLLQCPAAMRIVSYEPALGPVNFTSYMQEPARLHVFDPSARDKLPPDGPVYLRRGNKIDWIIVGGESGPSARPFLCEWARDVIKQGAKTGTPVFVKQIGSTPYDGLRTIYTRDRKGGDMSEWPDDIRVREYPKPPAGAKDSP